MKTQIPWWPRRFIVPAAVGATLGGLLGMLTPPSHAWTVLAATVVLGAGPVYWASRLRRMTAARRHLVLRRVAAGAGFGAMIGLAQFGAVAALPAGKGVPWQGAVGLALILVPFGALFGAMSGDDKVASEDAEGHGPRGEDQRVKREAAIKKYGLPGFARRAALRLAEARRKPDDTRGLDEFGP